MTDIEVAGEYEGISGKFKWRGSFPVILKPCDYLVDKVKLNKIPTYICLHGRDDGAPQMSTMSTVPTGVRNINEH